MGPYGILGISSMEVPSNRGSVTLSGVWDKTGETISLDEIKEIVQEECCLILGLTVAQGASGEGEDGVSWGWSLSW